jgi:hypothetical protein
MALRTPDMNGVPLEGKYESFGLREQTDDRLPPEPVAVALGGEAPSAEKPGGLSEDEALRIAREAYETSTDYVDENYRKKWETNLRYFDSRHASDSKYYKDAYKHRHKHFRPKSRSISRRIEALVANAYFSNEQLASVEPQNPSDPMSAATAAMVQSLLDYRLKKSIPWFLTVVGGMQDAVKTGVVVSYNYWCYRSKPEIQTEMQPAGIDMMGQPIMVPVQVMGEKVLEDKPKIELFLVEYLRISPNAKWDDPINSSPYVGRMVPMHVNDIRARMTQADRAGYKWREYSDAEIVAKGQLKERDTTTQTRLTGRTDPKEDHTEVKDYEIAWAIEWFIDRDGERYCYWTLGTDAMLTDVRPLGDVYLHNRIPITMGYCVLETHKPMPDGIIGIGAPTQRIINDNVNMRNDNVALVLSKQWAIRAGQQVDTSNLMYGVPGGVTAFQNPDTDVRPLEWNDVTSSAYQEQDRHNVDYDELVGNFSASSVMTGKNMSETVGGMEILGSGAATLSEYTVRIFTETWVIPTLNQLAALEQFYETDETIFAICGPQAQEAYRLKHSEYQEGVGNVAPESPAVDEIIENLIREDAMVTVSVGMNATDPNRKLQRFLFACNQVAQFAANMPPAANTAEMAKEVFRILGFGDGARFWDANAAAKQMLEQAKQTAEAMLKETDTMARQIMDQADQRRRNAEQAEEAAMEEQQQLKKETYRLMERGVAAAMKELKVNHEQEVLALREQIAVLKLKQAAQPAKGPATK